MVDRICDNCMSRVPAGTDKCPQCGIRFENTNPGGALPNGWVLGGRYTVGRYIDIDGEGVTYSAIDGDNLQRVIIKEFMPVTLCSTRDDTGAILPKPGCEVLFKTTRMDYSELYGILLRMGLVEGLVQVLDVLEENNTAYAVIEKIEGPTLAEYMMKLDGPVESERALSMLRPIFIGVDALHSASVIHRGISPDNIILESGGTARLSGYATLALRQQGSELKPKLYPGYSAPEQYAASEFEGRYTDVYALGAVIYRMVTGLDPYPADERRMQDNLRPAKAENKDVPAFLSTALSRAMRVAPAERIQNVPDLRLALTGEGGQEARGFLGLTKKQLIIGGICLGVIVVVLVILLLVGIFGGGRNAVSSQPSSSQSEVELLVPDFTEMVYADVVQSSSYKEDFTFGQPTEEYDTDVDEGKIISQTPKAGTVYEKGTSIVFVVSKGPKSETMPNLVGQLQSNAVAVLKELGVSEDNIKIETVENSGDRDVGTVVSTDPIAGNKIPIGKDTVTLRVAGDVNLIPLPYVVGKSIDEARSILEGYQVEVQTIENDGTHASGTVESTNPPAGTEVAPSVTNIVVYVYDTYKMPDLSSYIGKDTSKLTSFLDARGIQWTYGENVITQTQKQDGKIAAVDQPPVNSVVDSSVLITIRRYQYQAPTTPADPNGNNAPG